METLNKKKISSGRNFYDGLAERRVKESGTGNTKERNREGLRKICQGIHAASEVCFQLSAGVLGRRGNLRGSTVVSERAAGARGV